MDAHHHSTPRKNSRSPPLRKKSDAFQAEKLPLWVNSATKLAGNTEMLFPDWKLNELPTLVNGTKISKLKPLKPLPRLKPPTPQPLMLSSPKWVTKSVDENKF